MRGPSTSCKTPRIYATKDVEQLMPNFDFQDADIENLRVFLASLHRQPRYPNAIAHPGTAPQDNIVTGRRDGQLLQLRRMPHHRESRRLHSALLSADRINFAPPILNGEGAKVQPDWLFSFLQAPTPIRPWLKIRMPTFHLTITKMTRWWTISRRHPAI